MTSSATTDEDRQQATTGRLPGVLITLGGLLFIGGVAVPVIARVFDNLGDPAVIQAAIESEPTAWDVAALLSGTGTIVTAIGLFLLGRRTSQISSEPRARTAATVGSWLGLGVAAWVATAAYRVLATPDVLAENVNGLDWWNNATSIVWFVGIAGSSVAFGLMLVWLRHRRVLGWLLLSAGPLLAIAGIMLPVIPYFGDVLAGVVLALSPPRTRA